LKLRIRILFFAFFSRENRLIILATSSFHDSTAK